MLDNPSRSAVSVILRPACMESKTVPHSEFPKSPFFHYSDTQFEIQQVVLTTSACLNALSCCHAVG